MQRQNKDYKKIEVIGKGSYGTVYKAEYQGKAYAIKKMDKIFDDPRNALRFLREIKLLRMLKGHSNIINLCDIQLHQQDDSFDSVELVFDYCDASLTNIEQRLQKIQTQYILYQLICGLHYMHSAGIAHRDLKPQNILINTNCHVRICDFGLARPLNIPVELETQTQQQLESKQEVSKNFRFFRRKSTHVTTRWYRSPEVILHSDYYFGLDMWSLGCIFGELLRKQVGSGYSDFFPLFRGLTSYPFSINTTNDKNSDNDQYHVITGIVGTPSKEDLEFVPEAVRDILDGFYAKLPIPWKVLFPNADEVEINLLSRLLTFNPNRRIKVSEAINHPYFDSVRAKHNSTYQIKSDSLNDYAYLTEYYAQEKTYDLSGTLDDAQIRKLILKEINHYREAQPVVNQVQKVAVAKKAEIQSKNKVANQAKSTVRDENKNPKSMGKKMLDWMQVVANGLDKARNNRVIIPYHLRK